MRSRTHMYCERARRAHRKNSVRPSYKAVDRSPHFCSFAKNKLNFNTFISTFLCVEYFVRFLVSLFSFFFPRFCFLLFVLVWTVYKYIGLLWYSQCVILVKMNGSVLYHMNSNNNDRKKTSGELFSYWYLFSNDLSSIWCCCCHLKFISVIVHIVFFCCL